MFGQYEMSKYSSDEHFLSKDTPASVSLCMNEIFITLKEVWQGDATMETSAESSNPLQSSSAITSIFGHAAVIRAMPAFVMRSLCEMSRYLMLEQNSERVMRVVSVIPVTLLSETCVRDLPDDSARVRIDASVKRGQRDALSSVIGNLEQRILSPASVTCAHPAITRDESWGQNEATCTSVLSVISEPAMLRYSRFTDEKGVSIATVAENGNASSPTPCSVIGAMNSWREHLDVKAAVSVSRATLLQPVKLSLSRAGQLLIKLAIPMSVTYRDDIANDRKVFAQCSEMFTSVLSVMFWHCAALRDSRVTKSRNATSSNLLHPTVASDDKGRL